MTTPSVARNVADIGSFSMTPHGLCFEHFWSKEDPPAWIAPASPLMASKEVLRFRDALR